jgi:hypothetical protein
VREKFAQISLANSLKNLKTNLIEYYWIAALTNEKILDWFKRID